jgi:trehalose 6-phosphate phosphatase
MWTEALRQRDKLLLMLDFDGTLVPIATEPEKIEVSPRVAPLLLALISAGHRVFILTGRRADVVYRHLGLGVPVIGLHGLEWPDEPLGPRHPRFDELVRRAQEMIDEDIRLFGALVEDKGLSIALHYRNTSDRAVARALLRSLVLRSIANDVGLDVLEGHCVVEVRPTDASKAHAVKRLVERYPKHLAIYVGDDLTDEEAFAVLPAQGIGVRVAE